jgi:hypothetical protein
MSYLNRIANAQIADNISSSKYLELKRAYENATPEEKRAMDGKQANSKWNTLAKESNPKTSEQKTLEAILKNTSTIVNIMTFYLVLTILSILIGLYTFSQL